jgi:hypothetical protein
MTRTLAPQTPATNLLDSAFLLLSMLTTTALAQLTGVMLQLELFTMMLSFVTIRTLALTNLAMLKQDASLHTTEERIVTITTFVPLTDAPKIKQNVFILLSIVTTKILAPLILAIKFLDANTLL